MKASKAIHHLFVSKTRQKLINIFFSIPSEIFYVRQLVRKTKEEINSVRRELKNLLNAGIIASEVRGNRLYYWAEPNSPLFYNLCLLSHQISGLSSKVSKKTRHKHRLNILLYSNHFLLSPNLNTEAIDMIFVGEISLAFIEPLIKEEEAKIGREINYMIMGKKELKLRKQRRDPLIVDFFLNAPAVIIGNPSSIYNL